MSYDGSDEWDDYDYCYECTGYGDDCIEDEDGELIDACDDCPFNPYNQEEDQKTKVDFNLEDYYVGVNR